MLLEDQDRALWDGAAIAEGWRVLERAARPAAGPVPAAGRDRRRPRPGGAGLDLVASLYGQLAHVKPSQVVELNRAVAVAMDEGPERGLELLA